MLQCIFIFKLRHRPEARPSKIQIGKRTGSFEDSISWTQKHWSN